LLQSSAALLGWPGPAQQAPAVVLGAGPTAGLGMALSKAQHNFPGWRPFSSSEQTGPAGHGGT